MAIRYTYKALHSTILPNTREVFSYWPPRSFLSFFPLYKLRIRRDSSDYHHHNINYRYPSHLVLFIPFSSRTSVLDSKTVGDLLLVLIRRIRSMIHSTIHSMIRVQPEQHNRPYGTRTAQYKA